MHNNTLFSKILKIIPKAQFNKIVDTYSGNKSIKTFRCWDQFASMLYGQIIGCESMRDMVSCYNANHNLFYHTNTRAVKRSTLSDTNRRVNSSIYEKLFLLLFNKYSSSYKSREMQEMVRLIDSTKILVSNSKNPLLRDNTEKAMIKVHLLYNLTYDLPEQLEIRPGVENDLTIAKEVTEIKPGSYYVFDRGYLKYEWWNKLNKGGAYFVTRFKKTNKRIFKKDHSVNFSNKNIQYDRVVGLIKQKTKKGCCYPYKQDLREVYVQDDYGNDLYLVTNDFSSSAECIADLYKSRWQIEIFFKWLKQNLKIKRFYGRSIAAIKTQIYIAMIAYLLIRMVAKELGYTGCFRKFFNICRTQLISRFYLCDIMQDPPPRKKHRKNSCENINLFNYKAYA